MNHGGQGVASRPHIAPANQVRPILFARHEFPVGSGVRFSVIHRYGKTDQLENWTLTTRELDGVSVCSGFVRMIRLRELQQTHCLAVMSNEHKKQRSFKQ